MSKHYVKLCNVYVIACYLDTYSSYFYAQTLTSRFAYIPSPIHNGSCSVEMNCDLGSSFYFIYWFLDGSSLNTERRHELFFPKQTFF